MLLVTVLSLTYVSVLTEIMRNNAGNNEKIIIDLHKIQKYGQKYKQF